MTHHPNRRVDAATVGPINQDILDDQEKIERPLRDVTSGTDGVVKGVRKPGSTSVVGQGIDTARHGTDDPDEMDVDSFVFHCEGRPGQTGITASASATVPGATTSAHQPPWWRTA